MRPRGQVRWEKWDVYEIPRAGGFDLLWVRGWFALSGVRTLEECVHALFGEHALCVIDGLKPISMNDLGVALFLLCDRRSKHGITLFGLSI